MTDAQPCLVPSENTPWARRVLSGCASSSLFAFLRDGGAVVGVMMVAVAVVGGERITYSGHKRGLYRHMRPARDCRIGGKADIAGGVSKPFRRPYRARG